MSRTVFCRKYREELPGLEQPPFPGPKGQEIFEQVSRRAWEEWLAHQTMLINENRLTLIDPEARRFLEQELEKFLFGDGSAAPTGFVPKDG